MNSKIFASRRPLLLSTLLAALLLAASVLRAEARLEETVVHSPAMEGNLLGDSPDRNATAYLPPGYDENPDQRYPAVYLLHGFLGTNKVWTTGGIYGAFKIQEVADALIASGAIKPLIIVMPDAYNRYGGSMYTNSPTIGNWEDFIVRDLVGYVDGHYRTIPQAASRGIAGHSMGGYGAVKLAIKHPEVFSAVYGLSTSLVTLPAEFAFAFVPVWRSIADYEDLGQLSTLTIDHFLFLASTAAFTPNPDKPPFFVDFLFELKDGNPVLIEAVWSRFSAHFLLNVLDEYRANLLELHAIHLVVGTRENDPISGIAPNRSLSQALTDAGIDHGFEEVEGDHVSYVAGQIEVGVLPFFSEVLSVELGPAAVEATSWGWIKVGVQD